MKDLFKEMFAEMPLSFKIFWGLSLVLGLTITVLIITALVKVIQHL